VGVPQVSGSDEVDESEPAGSLREAASYRSIAAGRIALKASSLSYDEGCDDINCSGKPAKSG